MSISLQALLSKQDTRIRPFIDRQDLPVCSWCHRCGCELYNEKFARIGLCEDCLPQENRLQLFAGKCSCNGFRKLRKIRN